MNSTKKDFSGCGLNENCSGIDKAIETKDERAARLYKSPGGPLLGWLFDEAHHRGENIADMAEALGVTVGYIRMLMFGQRPVSSLTRAVNEACAEYLGVPPVVVMLVSGQIRMSDFSLALDSDMLNIDRAIRQIASDPKVRQSMPVDLMSLALDAKKAIICMYQRHTSVDLFEAQRLPDMVRWLQRAALKHDEAGFQTQTRHRDTSARFDECN